MRKAEESQAGTQVSDFPNYEGHSPSSPGPADCKGFEKVKRIKTSNNKKKNFLVSCHLHENTGHIVREPFNLQCVGSCVTFALSDFCLLKTLLTTQPANVSKRRHYLYLAGGALQEKGVTLNGEERDLGN